MKVFFEVEDGVVVEEIPDEQAVIRRTIAGTYPVKAIKRQVPISSFLFVWMI